MVTQKITGTEVTKFDDDFSKLEKASDIYIDLQVKLIFSIFLTIKILHFCGFLTKPKNDGFETNTNVNCGRKLKLKDTFMRFEHKGE